MQIATFHINYSQFGVDTTPLAYIMSNLEKYFTDDIIYPVNQIDTLFDTSPDIICFYLKETFLFNKFVNIANDVKNKINKPIILLGEHITALPKTLPKFVDVAIVGEYEETICDLVSIFKENLYLEKNKISKIKGVAFYDNNSKFVITEKRNYIKDMDTLQFTRKNFYGMPDIWIPTIVTGRGNCLKNIFTQFIDTPIRLHSYEWLIGNCVDIITYFPDIEYVEIQDYLFLYDRKRFLDFAKVVKETNLSKYFRFVVNSIPNQLDEEIIYNLKKNLNILKLNINIFSTSEKIQNDVKDFICTKENLISILDKCEKLDLEVNLQFGLGSSIETQEDIAKHYWFIENNINNRYSNRINIFHKVYLPIPSSESWVRLGKKVETDKINDYALIDYNNINEKTLILNNNINIQDFICIKNYLSEKYENKNINIIQEKIIKLDNKTIHKLKKEMSIDALTENIKSIYHNNYENVLKEIKKAENNYIRYGTYYIEDNNEYIYGDFSLYKKIKNMIEENYFDFSKIDDYFNEINNLYYNDKMNYFLNNKDLLTLPVLDIIDFINKNLTYINNILQISYDTYDISELIDKDKSNFEYMNNEIFNQKKPRVILNKKFDCIISLFTLDTTVNNLRTIKYLYNVLNKDGYLILSFFNSQNIINMRNILFNKTNSYLFNKRIRNYLSINLLKDLLIKNKFNVLEIKNIKIPIKESYLNIDKVIIKFLNKLFNVKLEYNNFISTIVCRKL